MAAFGLVGHKLDKFERCTTSRKQSEQGGHLFFTGLSPLPLRTIPSAEIEEHDKGMGRGKKELFNF